MDIPFDVESLLREKPRFWRPLAFACLLDYGLQRIHNEVPEQDTWEPNDTGDRFKSAIKQLCVAASAAREEAQQEKRADEIDWESAAERMSIYVEQVLNPYQELWNWINDTRKSEIRNSDVEYMLGMTIAAFDFVHYLREFPRIIRDNVKGLSDEKMSPIRNQATIVFDTSLMERALDHWK